MTELEEDDIYDDGLSITNKIAVTGIKSIFESAPSTGPKPKVPLKPGSKFSPKNDSDTKEKPSMNGGIPVLPTMRTHLRDGNKDAKSGDIIPKRNSKVNIPDIFSKNESLKPVPKPPPKPISSPLFNKDGQSGKPQNTVPWSQRHLRKDSDSEKSQNEHSQQESDKKVSTPNLPNKPSWANRQRQGSETDETPGKLTWSQRQALKVENSSNSENTSSPKSPNTLKKDDSIDHPKKRPSVLEKYRIQEKLESTVGGHPKPHVPVSPGIEEDKEQSGEKTESEKHSPRRPKQGAIIAGLTSASNLESVIGGLKHVPPKKEISHIKTDESVSLRNKPGDSSSNQRKSFIRKSITRHVDGQKFYAVEFSEKKFSKPPAKPPKIKEKFDLDKIIADYQALILDLVNNSSTSSCGVTEEDEDLYEPIPADEDIPMRESVSRASRAVSLIQPMTEKDEYDSQEEYDDCEVKSPRPDLPKQLPPLPDLPDSSPPARPPKSKPPPVPTEDLIEEEEYNDCETAPQDEELEQDDVYEPLDDINEAMEQLEEKKTAEQELKKDEKTEEKKDDKLSEKERKKREKEELKRLREEKKKQDKEMKELKSKFKVEPFQLKHTQGEGNIRKDAKGGKLDLQVKSGLRVVIIRLVNNPAGKWLVKLKEEGKVGYVDANNVEVDNNIIRNVMEGSYVNMHQLSVGENAASTTENFDQEEYADADVEQEEYADVDNVAPIQ